MVGEDVAVLRDLSHPCLDHGFEDPEGRRRQGRLVVRSKRRTLPTQHLLQAGLRSGVEGNGSGGAIKEKNLGSLWSFWKPFQNRWGTL